MKKLVCTLIIFATLLSLCACKNSGKDTKDIKETCVHTWDQESENCQTCGISCLQVLKESIKNSPDLVQGIVSKKYISKDHTTLTLSITDSELDISIEEKDPQSSSTETNTFSFTIYNQLTQRYSFRYSSVEQKNGITLWSTSAEGEFEANNMYLSSSFNATSIRSNSPVYNPYKSDPESLKLIVVGLFIRPLSATAIQLLDDYLSNEHLGFTSKNLGFICKEPWLTE